MGQTADLVPADRKLYALRDVTGTVPSIPLIVSSIMSKKLASGADVIVLDVKCGDGSFMKTEADAEILAGNLTRIGRLAGRKCAAIITDMDQPLGSAVGNALEVREAISVLKGEEEGDLLRLCLALGSCMLTEAGFAEDRESAESMLRDAISSGRALDKFCEMVTAQGGDEKVIRQPQLLPTAPYVLPLKADQGGWISRIRAEEAGLVSMRLGGGREKKDDRIDPAVGLIFKKKLGDRVEPGDVLAEVHASSPEKGEEAVRQLKACFSFSETPVERPPFVKKLL